MALAEQPCHKPLTVVDYGLLNFYMAHVVFRGRKSRAAFGLWFLFSMLLAVLSISGAEAPGTVLWKYDASQIVQSSPAVGPDGTIYFGSNSGYLYALNPNGSKKWDFRTAGNVAASPMIGPDGTIYVGSADKIVYALSPEGNLKWLTSPGSAVVSTPAIGVDGTVFVAGVFNKFVAINSETGRKKWEFTTGGNIVSSPLMNNDGLLVFGGQDGRLYTLDQSGVAQWNFQVGEKINSSPALGPNGEHYFGALDGRLIALTSAGKQLWDFTVGGPVRSSPAVGPDGTIYYGSDAGKLHALAPDGNARWAFPTGGWVRSSPAIARDGTVYFGSYDGKVYAVNDGNAVWTLETGGYVSSSPAIGLDGTIYVGSWDNHLYAIAGSSPLADSSWPMFGGNAAHSGSKVKPTPTHVVSLIDLDAGKVRTPPAILRLSVVGDGSAEPLTKVEIFRDNKLVETLEDAPFAHVAQSVPAGKYTFTAKGYFPSGKILESDSVVVIVGDGSVESMIKPIVEVGSTPATPPRNQSPSLAKEIFSGNLSKPMEAPKPSTPKESPKPKPAPEKVEQPVMVETPPAKTPKVPESVELKPEMVKASEPAPEPNPEPKPIESRLSLKVVGEGVVEPDLDGESLVIGDKYNLTARPKLGHQFAGWRGGATNIAASLEFTMAENLELTAVFASIPTPWVGSYYGLVRDPVAPVSIKRNGLVDLSVNQDGSFSGTLNYGGKRYTFRDSFDGSGKARLEISRFRDEPIMMGLKLGEGEEVSGILVDDGGAIVLQLDRIAETGSAQAGLYTLLLMPSVQGGPIDGDGFGELSVSDDGRLSFKGELADGTDVSQTGAFSKDGVWSVYLPFSDGAVSGWIRSKSADGVDLVGSLTWVSEKLPQTNGDDVPGSMELSVFGARFVSPGRRNPVMVAREATLIFQNGGLEQPVTFPIQIAEDNDVKVMEDQGFRARVRISETTGTFSGTFYHPKGGRTSFQGALLQLQNAGSGYFIGPEGTGQVIIRPFGVAQP